MRRRQKENDAFLGGLRLKIQLQAEFVDESKLFRNGDEKEIGLTIAVEE